MTMGRRIGRAAMIVGAGVLVSRILGLLRDVVFAATLGANALTDEYQVAFVIPDFLANAGGVTCSYFEQVQSNMNYFWEKDEVLGKLDTKMTTAFHAVHDLSQKKKLPMRDAAYVIAVSRVAQACRDRGWV